MIRLQNKRIKHLIWLKVSNKCRETRPCLFFQSFQNYPIYFKCVLLFSFITIAILVSRRDTLSREICGRYLASVSRGSRRSARNVEERKRTQGNGSQGPAVVSTNYREGRSRQSRVCVTLFSIKLSSVSAV